MTEGRHYSTGDTAALMVLCRGACYMPGCGVPAVVEIEPGKWALNLQRAHIAALNPGGPRHGLLPSGVDVNSFANILMLCVPHHLLIDKLDPDRFPVSVLLEWKTKREKDGQAALAGLKNVTEEGLQDAVTGAIKGYHERVATLIDRVEQFDSQTAQMLRTLSSDLADFRSGQYGPDPDTASMLYDASMRLPDIDTAGMLSDAADKLSGLDPDTISQLSDAASTLSGLNEDTIAQLSDAADRLARATRNLPEY